MQFLKNQATEYAQQQFGGTSAGHPQQAHDGLDWNNLTNLARFQQSAEEDPETDSGFMGLASKLMGGATGAHPTQAGFLPAPTRICVVLLPKSITSASKHKLMLLLQSYLSTHQLCAVL